MFLRRRDGGLKDEFLRLVVVGLVAYIFGRQKVLARYRSGFFFVSVAAAVFLQGLFDSQEFFEKGVEAVNGFAGIF